MQVVHQFEELRPLVTRTCLAIGVFDGVHRGHQRVLSAAMEEAASCDATAVALTFDPHPMRVLAPERAPRLLTSTAHRLSLINATGIGICLAVKFDQKFADTLAEDFIQRVATGVPQLQAICVGARFRFGKGREGNVQLMRQLGERYGYRLHEISSVMSDNRVVSSTAIRNAVAAGDLKTAALMLGRPFSILGDVVKGDQIGRTIGFPTANLNPHNEVLPPLGVYAVKANLGGVQHPGVLNIGVRPTVKDSKNASVSVELHVLDFSGDLYGANIEVLFVQHLRDEQKFSSLNELRAQIQRDEQRARSVLLG